MFGENGTAADFFVYNANTGSVTKKEGVNDSELIAYLTDLVHDVPEIDVYSGNDDMIVPLLSLGGKGVISVLSTVVPAETSLMCKKFFDGDVKGAMDVSL